MSYDPQKVEQYCFTLEERLLSRYHHYIEHEKAKLCGVKNNTINNLAFPVFNVSLSSLHEAFKHIISDIKIILLRRKNLIKALHPSEGKIAGIITFRLARAQVVHLCQPCLNCQPKCLLKANTIIAIKMGLDYLQVPYLKIPKEIRDELIYTIRNRHVNQETLGLVINTIHKVMNP